MFYINPTPREVTRARTLRRENNCKSWGGLCIRLLVAEHQLTLELMRLQPARAGATKLGGYDE